MRTLILASVLIADTASAQIDVADAPDPYVQSQSGMRFPAQIGPFERHQVVRYNADGSDTGVGYQLIKDGRKIGYVSVFVYPASPAIVGQSRERVCATAFEGIKRSITSREPGARIEKQGYAASPNPRNASSGLRATFSGGTIRFDGQEQIVTEQATLYCDVADRWLVAYRATWPEGEAPALAIEMLVKALGWPREPSR